ncbi:MAG: ThuA domain-containing protein [Myxococcota bacterium]
MKRRLAFPLTLLVAACLLAPASAQSQQARVLVFSKTEGFRHGSISEGLSLIQSLGVANDFAVDATEDASDFTTANLDLYDAVVWLSTTGDVLNATQQTAFEGFIQSGGGYVGIHAATDTEYGWPWYGGLLGGDAWFQNHPSIQEAILDVADPTQNSTAHLPASFAFTDEWYNFQNDPSSLVNVLLTIDETTYNGGTMGSSHPISWQHEYDGGRSWYTAMGHRNQTFQDADFQQHLLGGIEWAVPEPSFGAMLCAGLLWLGLGGGFGARRRRA